MNHQCGAVRAVSNSLTHASQRSDTVQAARAEDHEIGQRRVVAQGSKRMPRIPLCDAFGPRAVALDSLPARGSYNPKRRAESLG